MNKILEKYLSLRNSVDTESERLFSLHSTDMKCREGCSSCCMDFSILPVEFYFIAGHADKIKSAANTKARPGECIFLNKHRCTIYDLRPVICRTHGFPLLSMGEEEWELSHCELNFTSGENDFTAENTFEIDRINSELFLLNREFLSSDPTMFYSEFDLLPLSSLPSSLDENGQGS